MFFSRRVLLGALSCLALAWAESIDASLWPTSNRGLVQPRLEQLTLSSQFKITNKPTTRIYDFTVSMQEGAPDGFYRQMLVVNGL